MEEPYNTHQKETITKPVFIRIVEQREYSHKSYNIVLNTTKINKYLTEYNLFTVGFKHKTHLSHHLQIDEGYYYGEYRRVVINNTRKNLFEEANTEDLNELIRLITTQPILEIEKNDLKKLGILTKLETIICED